MKKAFTLVEAVITIGVLSIVVAMTGVLIGNMVRIQNGISYQISTDNQINNAETVIRDYVSFVSLKNNEVSFSYSIHSNTSITYTCETYSYSLKLIDKTLSFGCDTTYSGSDSYFLTNESATIDDLQDFKLSYYDDIQMIDVMMKINNEVSHRNYYVRVKA